MKVTNVIKKLNNLNVNTSEIVAMLTSFDEARTEEDEMFYYNQIYGFLVGIAAVCYIRRDDIPEIMDNLAAGDL